MTSFLNFFKHSKKCWTSFLHEDQLFKSLKISYFVAYLSSFQNQSKPQFIVFCSGDIVKTMDANHTCYKEIIQYFDRLRILFSQYLSNDSSVRAEIFTTYKQHYR